MWRGLRLDRGDAKRTMPKRIEGRRISSPLDVTAPVSARPVRLAFGAAGERVRGRLRAWRCTSSIVGLSFSARAIDSFVA